ncbi:hypothetical protein FNW52_02245 [Flavobacterium sp. ZT3R18]|uniref:DUF5958 family protein n=1 Tax=Flavobacterium sp. ZT3R18 TaxID=2594429 RepID=UPI00117B3C59|nr:DUF5958 family protein [Flavobacterium sp. ZT3R18]TRX38886.1 hypothetical protein FNW52_02245 [Flavobacterium sp. ZT3R18]
MDNTEGFINKIAQNEIDFNEGINQLLLDENFNFDELFTILKNYIFNSIPNKDTYENVAYKKAINSIPLKQNCTPIVILNNFETKIAFNKLSSLSDSEYQKTIISLVWIFKITDTERRNTECKDGCKHYWHNPIARM